MVKNLAASAGDITDTGLGGEDPLEEGMTTHSSIFGESMDRGAWWATVQRVAKSWTRLKRQHLSTVAKASIGRDLYIIYNIDSNF